MSACRSTEADFQASVVDAARLLGWRVHHQRPARTATGWRTAVTGDVGFPDLVLVRGGRLVVAELKSARGWVTVEQQAWLADLEAAGVEVHVWRPGDWDEVVAVLRRPSHTRS